jgi:hypothetical protein
MSRAEEFATRHDVCATSTDVARIRRQLSRFYEAVEAIDRPFDSYIQLHRGEAVRTAFVRCMDASIAMAEMPDHWPTKYRASVAYHLAPFLDDVVNS